MLRTLRHLLVTAVCAAMVLGTGTAIDAAGAAQARHRRASPPSLWAAGVPGGVRFSWPTVARAKKYRVQWSAAPYGKWPGPVTYLGSTRGGWMSRYTRGAGLTVPATPGPGDRMLAVPYANAVFARLQVRRAHGGGGMSRWVPVFPQAPDPGPGDQMRLGTYNVMLNPTDPARVNAIATNILTHGLDVVALQEANAATARALLAVLPGWASAPSGTAAPQQIIYRTAKYRVDRSGTFLVPDPRQPSVPIPTPWAHLVPVSPAMPGHSQAFYVVSVHFTEDVTRTQMEKKRDTGLAAQAALGAINNIDPTGEPVIAAGDMRYMREPWGDVPGYVEAPPTFVRAGYYDAMAAVSKIGYQYQTVNAGGGAPNANQVPQLSGVGARSDYIMLRGFRGSRGYTNVYNWAYGGLVPSDHNLVYADLTVPFLP